jgi:hypothetical protein
MDKHVEHYGSKNPLLRTIMMIRMNYPLINLMMRLATSQLTFWLTHQSKYSTGMERRNTTSKADSRLSTWKKHIKRYVRGKKLQSEFNIKDHGNKNKWTIIAMERKSSTPTKALESHHRQIPNSWCTLKKQQQKNTKLLHTQAIKMANPSITIYHFFLGFIAVHTVGWELYGSGRLSVLVLTGNYIF